MFLQAELDSLRHLQLIAALSVRGGQLAMGWQASRSLMLHWVSLDLTVGIRIQETERKYPRPLEARIGTGSP